MTLLQNIAIGHFAIALAGMVAGTVAMDTRRHWRQLLLAAIVVGALVSVLR